MCIIDTAAIVVVNLDLWWQVEKHLSIVMVVSADAYDIFNIFLKQLFQLIVILS